MTYILPYIVKDDIIWNKYVFVFKQKKRLNEIALMEKIDFFRTFYV